MKILLVGIYDTDTVSLAPHVLKSYVSQFAISSRFEIVTKEFSIFTNTPESIVRSIKEERPDVVGYSTYIWNVNYVLEIVKHIDAVNILGGPQVTGIEHELITENPNIAIVVTGEGETTFKELLEYLSGSRQLDDICGITTKDVKTMPSDPIEDLDSIPPLFDRLLTENPNLNWISYETSRGCPMACKFCTWSYAKRMRYFSLERVKKDLDIILNHDNIKHILFSDSSLLVDKNRAKAILKYLIDGGANTSIRFEFDAEHLDDEIIDLLTQLPGGEFNFGIQTINKRALDDMGRKFHRDRFESNYYKLLRKLQKPNLTIDLIYGLPGDDIDGYRESLNYAISLDGVKRILTNPLIILPGSEFYREMDRYKIQLRDKRSYIIKANYTFSARQMGLAKKFSFLVSVIYLNECLRDCTKAFAQRQRIRYIDTIIGFMESLSFDLSDGLGYPYMIPSVREDFEHRNKVMRNVIERYGDIVVAFKQFTHHEYDAILADYEKCFSDQFYKFRRFVGID